MDITGGDDVAEMAREAMDTNETIPLEMGPLAGAVLLPGGYIPPRRVVHASLVV